ncbi:hypothetical protein L3V82_03875 [Thiotrichales bacterium 19S3-7]|nr:hypothetical protein [Thiotrichales bacterium 19S3-7]MCF6801812.1 hypothetical protein [Thiotrichales bacterium 19S3-11]
MIKYVICIFLIFSSSIIYATGSFSVQNDLSSSDYIHLGPNGGASDISIQSNPDHDSWYLDGDFAGKKQQAHYYIESPDGFAKKDRFSDPSVGYSPFNYNTEANLDIYIYNNQNQQITTCPISGVYYDQSQEVTMAPNNTQPCNNRNYYVQDDGGSFNPKTLYVHYLNIVSEKKYISVKNDIGGSDYIHLGSSITIESNPDNDVWGVSDAYATNGDEAEYEVTSPTSFFYTGNTNTAPDYGIFNYNTAADIDIYIYNSENQQITICPVSGVYYSGQVNMVAISGDLQYCKDANYYVQDDQRVGFMLDTLFVHKK